MTAYVCSIFGSCKIAFPRWSSLTSQTTNCTCHHGQVTCADRKRGDPCTASESVSSEGGELHLLRRQVHLLVEKQLDLSVVWKNVGVCPSVKRGIGALFQGPWV